MNPIDRTTVARAEALARACLVLRHGRAGARRLLAQFGSGESALATTGLDDAQRALRETLELCPYRLLIDSDPLYPALLREIPDPPLVLYTIGRPELFAKPCVAVVGARRCSRSGASHAHRLAREIAALGMVVVSGLALGIDGSAHRGALETGLTAAVLGAGLARIYPRTHQRLAQDIVEAGGVLMSEYPPTQPAYPSQFPERNRLISGLVRAVLVVEAGEHSGSLITARMALEQGRDVMAVPGSISNPAARGCHRLIREGAALVESVADVAAALGLEQMPGAAAVLARPGPAEPGLEHLLAHVGADAVTLDELVAQTGQRPPEILAALVELELAGFVEQVPGGYIRRADR